MFSLEIPADKRSFRTKASPFGVIASILVLCSVTVAESPYGPTMKLCDLANAKVTESSGIAMSWSNPGVFWTHNDSGDDAVLYAFDIRGRDLGGFKLRGIRAVDWEDIATFKYRGKNYILVGDIGDNDKRRAYCQLVLAEDPRINLTKPDEGLKVEQVIRFTYEDGPRDCEALAVDPTLGKIYLVSKVLTEGGAAGIYELDIPAQQSSRRYVARKIGSLDILGITGMDISANGRKVVLVTYMYAFEYLRTANESWAQAFGAKPDIIPMPGRRQGEAICYSLNAKALVVTSESGRDTATPVWLITPFQSGKSGTSP